MIQRGGELVLKVVDNVQQKTIKPLIEKHVTKGSTAYTDEYVIYGKMTQWGDILITLSITESESMPETMTEMVFTKYTSIQ